MIPTKSSLTMPLAPPEGSAWIYAAITVGKYRDYATGNPINTQDVFTYTEHEMAKPFHTYALESNYDYPWAVYFEVTRASPLVITFTNNTKRNVIMDGASAVFVVNEPMLPKVRRLWRGWMNLMWILGGLNVGDLMEEVADKMKEEELPEDKMVELVKGMIRDMPTPRE